MVHNIVIDSCIRLEDLRAVSPEDLGTEEIGGAK
jgi:hypothetical protein